MTTRYRLRDAELEWRHVDGEVVAVDTRDWIYLSANESGRVLWEALVDGATRVELADALVASFTVERGAAESDVDAFLAELGRRNLLHEEAS